MQTLQNLMHKRDSDWIERNLLTHMSPRNPDREELIELMISGLSPYLAAKSLHVSGKSSLGLGGLRWLASEVEEQLYAILGDTLENHIAEIIREGSTEISPSRTHRLTTKAEANGMRVVVTTRVRLE